MQLLPNSDRVPKQLQLQRHRSKTQLNEKFEELTRDQLFLKCIFVLKKPISSRSAADKLYIQQLTHFIPCFAQLIEGQMKFDLSESLQYQFVEKNSTIFNQGDKGDKFYIVLKGIVAVKIKIPNDKGELLLKEVGQLGEGQQFGELGLHEHQTRSATVVGVTQCHLAFMNKEIYNKLIGDYHRQLLQQKVDFFRSYKSFSTLTLRELRSLCSEVHEKSFDYGDKIDLPASIGFVKQGQVQLARKVQTQDFDHHPMKAVKLLKQSLQIDILHTNSLIGELNFLDENGELQFQVYNRDIQVLKKRANNPTMEFLVAELQNGSLLYEATCYSNHVTIYYIKQSIIQDRFFDESIRSIFRAELKNVLNTRIQKAYKMHQEFQKSYDDRLQLSKINYQLSNVRDKVSRYLTPQRENPNRALRTVSVSNENPLFVQFEKLYRPKLTSGPLYKYIRINKLEEQSRVQQTIDEDYSRIKTEENQAKEKFKQASQGMNCSYHRIKSYFNQKRIGNNKLYYQTFMEK